MSGVDAAATLSLRVETGKAVEDLAILKAEFAALQKKFEGGLTVGAPSTPFSNVVKGAKDAETAIVQFAQKSTQVFEGIKYMGTTQSEWNPLKGLAAATGKELDKVRAALGSQIKDLEAQLAVVQTKFAKAGSTISAAISSGGGGISNAFKLDEAQAARFNKRLEQVGLEAAVSIDKGLTRSNLSRTNQVISLFAQNTESSLTKVIEMSRAANRQIMANSGGTQTAQNMYGDFLVSGKAEAKARERIASLQLVAAEERKLEDLRNANMASQQRHQNLVTRLEREREQERRSAMARDVVDGRLEMKERQLAYESYTREAEARRKQVQAKWDDRAASRKAAAEATAEAWRVENAEIAANQRMISAAAAAEAARRKDIQTRWNQREASRESARARDFETASLKLFTAEQMKMSAETQRVAKVTEANMASQRAHQLLVTRLATEQAAAQKSLGVRSQTLDVAKFQTLTESAKISDAAQAYSSLGKRVYAAKVAVDQYGEAAARAFLGKNQYLVDQIRYLDKYISKVGEAKLVSSEAKSIAYLAGTPVQRASQDFRASIATSKGYDLSRYAPEAIISAGNLGSVAAARDALEVAKANAKLGDSHRVLGPLTAKSAEHQVHWNKIANEGHAAARGLAGAVGALWLTYGSLAPLLAGAAIAGGFKAAAKAGAEFEYQLTFVKALGGETSDAIEGISKATLAMAKDSMHAPTEMANGLRILAQAGLNAEDAMLALPTALDLATVGEMDMAQASITLAGVMNAFNLSVGDMGHIGDVFAKAAALSQTSVAGMTESMKTASVVAEQYGVSLEDAATGLTVLAKVNITGTSAGTSMRNMLKELYAPTAAAASTFKQLGLETANSQGQLRSFADIIYDLKGRLGEFDKASQVNILQKMFGERGAKEAVAMLSQTREQWDALKESISDSDGFIGRVAAQLEMTTKGRFQQALNTMQSNLVEAFNQSSGSVKTLADALKNLADSDEFKNTLNGLVSAVSQVSLALIEVTPLLINMGLAFAAFKGFSLLVGTVAAATSALGAFATSVGIVSSISAFAGGGLTGLKLGILATGSAAGVAAGATGLAGFSKAAALLFGPAGWVAAGIIALGSLAYAYYDAGKGASAATASADVFISGLDREIKKIREQNAELQKRNRLRAEGMDPDGIDLSAVERERAKIKSSRDALKAEMDSQPQVRTLFGLGGSTSAFKLRSQQAGLEKLDKALADADAKIGMGKLEQGVNVSAKLKTDLQGYDQQLRTLEKALDKGKNTKGAKEIAEMRKALDSYMPITGLIQDNKAASGIREYFGDKLDDTRMATLGSGDKKFVTEETPKSSSAGGAVSREVRDAQKTEAERLKDGLESGLKQKELLLRKEYLAVEVEIASQAISYSDAQIKRDQAALQAAESGLKLMEETLVKAEALTNKKDRDILILKTNNDIKEQGVKIENAQWGIVKNVTAARVAEANAIEDIGLSSSRYIKDLGFEREALNLTALEVEKLRIERERLRAIEDTRTQLNRKQISEPVAERQIQATNDTSNALIDAATEQETFVGGWSRAYKRYADEAGNAAGVATRVFNSASQSMGDALASFVQTGKLNFKDLASTIIAEATRAMVNKSVSDMLGNAGGIIKTLTGLFSPSSSVGPSAATGLGGTTWMGHSIMAPLKHSGGIVGTSEGSGSRLVSASTFYGAKRYHSGGVAGDEVPTILQKGEGVFTKGQMKAMGGGSNVQIVINNNGSKTEVQQKESIDSRGNRRVELTISDMVAGEVRRSGSSMNSALRGSFGSRQQLVGR